VEASRYERVQPLFVWSGEDDGVRGAAAVYVEAALADLAGRLRAEHGLEVRVRQCGVEGGPASIIAEEARQCGSVAAVVASRRYEPWLAEADAACAVALDRELPGVPLVLCAGHLLYEPATVAALAPTWESYYSKGHDCLGKLFPFWRACENGLGPPPRPRPAPDCLAGWGEVGKGISVLAESGRLGGMESGRESAVEKGEGTGAGTGEGKETDLDTEGKARGHTRSSGDGENTSADWRARLRRAYGDVGELAARARLSAFVGERLRGYEKFRHRADRGVPVLSSVEGGGREASGETNEEEQKERGQKDGTEVKEGNAAGGGGAASNANSELSAFLRWGLLSCRELYWAVKDAGFSRKISNTFARRVFWRDHAYVDGVGMGGRRGGGGRKGWGRRSERDRGVCVCVCVCV
jgi:deoxyribodipyrimidine photolyase